MKRPLKAPRRRDTAAPATPSGQATARAVDAAVLDRLSRLDRFLPVWIGLAMASGLLVGLVYVALWARGRFYPGPGAVV